MRAFASWLLGIVMALSLPVLGHRHHDTPRCERQPNPRSGPKRVAKYIRCVARIVPRFDVPEAIEVASCESGLDPRASNGGAYLGLYQHDADYWSTRAATHGFRGHSAFDPVAQTWVTARMVQQGGWGPWECAA